MMRFNQIDDHDPDQIIAFLEEQVQLLTKDAERYRWLKKCDRGALEGGAHVLIPGRYGITPATSGEELDAAIDRAMEEER